MAQMDRDLSVEFYSWCVEVAAFSGTWSQSLADLVEYEEKQMADTVAEADSLEEETYNERAAVHEDRVKDLAYLHSQNFQEKREEQQDLVEEYSAINAQLQHAKVLQERVATLTAEVNRARYDEKAALDEFDAFLVSHVPPGPPPEPPILPATLSASIVPHPDSSSFPAAASSASAAASLLRLRSARAFSLSGSNVAERHHRTLRVNASAGVVAVEWGPFGRLKNAAKRIEKRVEKKKQDFANKVENHLSGAFSGGGSRRGTGSFSGGRQAERDGWMPKRKEKQLKAEDLFRPLEQHRRRLEQQQRFCTAVAYWEGTQEARRRAANNVLSTGISDQASKLPARHVEQQKRQKMLDAVLERKDNFDALFEQEKASFSDRDVALNGADNEMAEQLWKRHQAWMSIKQSMDTSFNSISGWLKQLDSWDQQATMTAKERVQRLQSSMLAGTGEGGMFKELEERYQTALSRFCDLDGLQSQITDFEGRITSLKEDCESGKGKGAKLRRACRRMVVECERPSDFCREPGSSYSHMDCDGDGILDHACIDDLGNKRGSINSLNGCKSTWPSAAIQWCRGAWTCPRPVGYCSAQGMTYSNVDCDGDGIKDHACMDMDNHRGTISSLNGCKDSWSDAPISSCAAVFSCVRPVGWCLEGSYSKVDCDGDGVDDHACQTATGDRSVITSLGGCIDSGRKTLVSECPAAFSCVRPEGYCSAAGSKYSHVDCDGDGIEDHACALGDQRGTIRSGANCVSDWPVASTGACPAAFE